MRGRRRVPCLLAKVQFLEPRHSPFQGRGNSHQPSSIVPSERYTASTAVQMGAAWAWTSPMRAQPSPQHLLHTQQLTARTSTATASSPGGRSLTF